MKEDPTYEPSPWYAGPPRGGGRPLGPGDRRPRRWLARILIVIAFFAGVAIVGAVVLGGMRWVEERSVTSTTVASRNPTIRVSLTSGMSATEVGRVLEDEGVIESSAEFVDLVKSRGSESKLRPGTYRFSADMQLLEVVDALERGEMTDTFKITIPEGTASSQVAAFLAEEGNIDGGSYAELAVQPGKFVVPNVGTDAPEVTTLEGLLFPSTYYLMYGDGPTELIGAQLAAFESKTASLPWNEAEALGLSAYEIVIVASLIEKEASIADERPLVAAVIYNRLKQDMALGIDATVRFAVDKWTGPLTSDDLEVDSPYNTRVVKGLPPAPICNPGVAALRAALEPAKVNYLYYVLSDTAGHHFFTASYEEFLEAKNNAPEQ